MWKGGCDHVQCQTRTWNGSLKGQAYITYADAVLGSGCCAYTSETLLLHCLSMLLHYMTGSSGSISDVRVASEASLVSFHTARARHSDWWSREGHDAHA